MGQCPPPPPAGTRLCLQWLNHRVASTGWPQAPGCGWTCVWPARRPEPGFRSPAGPAAGPQTQTCALALRTLLLRCGSGPGKDPRARGGSAHSQTSEGGRTPARGGGPRRTLPSVRRSRSCRPGLRPPGGTGQRSALGAAGKGVPARPPARPPRPPRPPRPAYLPPVGSKFTLCRREVRRVSSAAPGRRCLGPQVCPRPQRGPPPPPARRTLGTAPQSGPQARCRTLLGAGAELERWPQGVLTFSPLKPGTP